MSLQTPTVIRTLQRKLYRKAKERKLLHRRRLRPRLFSVCLTMKLVGEPDAGDRHVWFDERGWETERCRMAQVTAPILDSAKADMAIALSDVCFSNRPTEVKLFQAIQHSSIDVAHGLALLFGLGTRALPSWDSKTRWNNLLRDLAVEVTAGSSGHTNSPHPSSREGHHSTVGWISGFLLFDLILCSSHAAATSLVHRKSVPSTQMRCMITANRRASATIAFFIPRCLAIFIAQALSQDHFVERASMIWAAS